MYSEENTQVLQTLIQKLFPLYLKSKIALMAEVTLSSPGTSTCQQLPSQCFWCDTTQSTISYFWFHQPQTIVRFCLWTCSHYSFSCPAELILCLAQCHKFYTAAAMELHQVEIKELKYVYNILCRKGLYQSLEYHWILLLVWKKNPPNLIYCKL